MQPQRPSLHPKCSLKKEGMLPGEGCQHPLGLAAPSTSLRRVGTWRQGETIPPSNPEPLGKYWLRARRGWITPSCPAEVSPSTQWASKPTMHSPKYHTGVGISGDERTQTQRDRSASVCAELTGLFAHRVGECLFRLVIQEDTRWEECVGGWTRN